VIRSLIDRSLDQIPKNSERFGLSPTSGMPPTPVPRAGTLIHLASTWLTDGGTSHYDYGQPAALALARCDPPLAIQQLRVLCRGQLHFSKNNPFLAIFNTGNHGVLFREQPCYGLNVIIVEFFEKQPRRGPLKYLISQLPIYIVDTPTLLYTLYTKIQ
jgi:hypothetical protein